VQAGDEAICQCGDGCSRSQDISHDPTWPFDWRTPSIEVEWPEIVFGDEVRSVRQWIGYHGSIRDIVERILRKNPVSSSIKATPRPMPF
jgi:hypothetical protein